MQFAVFGARVLLGLAFLVFGLNGFFNFIQPPEMNEAARSLIGALDVTGYFLMFLDQSDLGMTTSFEPTQSRGTKARPPFA